jgi:hypothetical protein
MPVHSSRQFVLTWEMIAYAVIAGVAALFFLAVLGDTALTTDEASAALAAWRFVDPAAPGADRTPPSLMVFFAQSVSFALLGASEATARLGTALAGVLLVLAPALFRRVLGIERALLLSALLVGSPVILIAARASSPMIWGSLLALLLLWALWRYDETRAAGWGAAALTFFAMLTLLVGAGGVVLALTTLLTLIIARLTTPPAFDDEAPAEASAAVRLGRRIRSFPWAAAAPAALLLVPAFATLFLTYPRGLATIGDMLTTTLTDAVRRSEMTPTAFALLISFFYEPWTWLLAFGIVVWMIRKHRPEASFADRFGVAWLLLGALAVLLYQNQQADFALWLGLPLALLVSRLALAFTHARDDAPNWALAIIALGGLALLAMGSVAFQGVARSISRFAGTALQFTQLEAFNVLILFFSLIFALVGYFLIRSFWERSSVSLRGVALTLLIFAGLTGIGSGWNASVTAAGDARDLWQRSAAEPNSLLLRETLLEVAELTHKGYTEMPLAVLSAGDPQIEWAVRDFRAARFIHEHAEVLGDGVVLLRVRGEGDLAPAFTAAYVGQPFVLSRNWSLTNLLPSDLLAWWAQRIVVVPTETTTEAILWVRTDVYGGATTSGLP